MDLRTRMEIEWQCRNLSHEFAYCIDHRKYEQLVTLFTPDGVFDRVGHVLKGRELILEAMHKRSTELRTRHTCSNIHFTDVSDESARAHVYVLNLVGRGDPDGKPVQYAMSQGAFLEFRDLYRKTPDGWRIAERIASTMIMPADAPQHR